MQTFKHLRPDINFFSDGRILKFSQLKCNPKNKKVSPHHHPPTVNQKQPILGYGPPLPTVNQKQQISVYSLPESSKFQFMVYSASSVNTSKPHGFDQIFPHPEVGFALQRIFLAEDQLMPQLKTCLLNPNVKSQTTCNMH